MPQSVEELAERLAAATAPGTRGRLVARGLARGMVWRNGEIPDGTPPFANSLTADLLDHGYAVLEQALRLKDAEVRIDLVNHSLRVAAEAIESAVRKGPSDPAKGFHLVVAASAFHIAGFGARSYCLVPSGEGANLATTERLLALLMRRSLRTLRVECVRWLANPAFQDAAIATRLADPADEMSLDDAEQVAFTGNFVRSVASFLSAQESGRPDDVQACMNRLAVGMEACGARGFVSMWWAYMLSRHLTEGLWDTSFHSLLPEEIDGPYAAQWRTLRSRFIAILRMRNLSEIDLWPSQVPAALRAADPTDDLVVALPTSAGKTRIAELCILRCLAEGRRVVYVTPLRALSAQLERGLSRTFRPLGFSVTSLYGASGVAVADIGTLKQSNIVVATPEKLDFAARLDPEVLDDVGLIVLDEGHMIGLGPREIRYEVLVQRLLQRPDAGNRRIVCLSAIFSEGDAFDDFTAWLRSDNPGLTISSTWRPTRQRSALLTWRDNAGFLSFVVEQERPFVKAFVPSENPTGRRKKTFPADDEELTIAAAKAFIRDGQRVLIYCPRRASVNKVGEAIVRLNRQGHFPGVLPADLDVSRALHVGEEWLGPDHVALRVLRLGVGLHHAALPRAFLAEIENLLDRKKLPLVVASPTIAQGLDLSCSVLIFRSLYRGRNPIEPNEFANVRGRAGRAFVDLDGITVYPIFDDGAKRVGKTRTYNELNLASQQRSLESGLVQLVESLIQLLAARLGVSHADLREQVINTAFEWAVRNAAVEPPPADDDEEEDVVDDVNGPRGDRLLADLLANLDTAILGTVSDLEIGIEGLATAIDQTLTGSLWARRIVRRAADDAALARLVIVGRSQWLWSRTDATQRKGFFNAGIGYATGKFLDENLPELIRQLVAFEAALLADDQEAAGAAVVAFAAIVSGVAPFEFEFRPDDWQKVLRTWVVGESLGPIVQEDGTEVAFIQNDVVFRLVWAAEAVRVHGIARDVDGVEELTGLAAMSLTYGVPSLQAALLGQAGLSSRKVAMKILASFPATFTEADGIPEWLEATIPRIPAALWDDTIDSEMWNEFAVRWEARGRNLPTEWRADLDVEWNAGEPVPAAGERVSLIHDTTSNTSWVCSVDFRPRGRLAEPLSKLTDTAVLRCVVTDDGRLQATLFGVR